VLLAGLTVDASIRSHARHPHIIISKEASSSARSLVARSLPSCCCCAGNQLPGYLLATRRNRI